jgi:hypothetical protein
MQQLFQEHVLVPLIQKAEPSLEGPDSLPAAASRWQLPELVDMVAWAQGGAFCLGQCAWRGLARCGEALRRQEAGGMVVTGVALTAVGLALVALRARAASQ